MEPAVGFGARLAALNRAAAGVSLRDSDQPGEIDKGDEDAIRALAFVGRADPDALVRFSPIPGAYGEFAVSPARPSIAFNSAGHISGSARIAWLRTWGASTGRGTLGRGCAFPG